MGVFLANDNSGRVYRFAITGSAPSENEMSRINAKISEINSKLPKPEPVPVEGGIGQWAAEVGKGALRGGVLGLTATPLRAVGGIGDYLMGNEEPGLLNRVARGIEQGAEATAGPAPGYEGGFASTIGELAGMAGSFILPGMAASRAAAGAMPAAGKLTTEAAKAMSSRAAKARLASEVGMGVMTGQAEAGKRADMYEEQTGNKVDVETRAIANLIGGAVGSTFALPMEKIAGPLAQVLKFVPAGRKEDAAHLIANRLKDAALVGGVGAGQNVVYGLVQDLAEQGLYNPNLDPSQSMMQNIVAGGSVAGLLHFLIGRNLAKSNAAERQLTDDTFKSQTDGTIKPALDELSKGLGNVGDVNNAEAVRMRNIAAQQANFSPAVDTSAYEASLGEQMRQDGRRERSFDKASELFSPMAQDTRQRSDESYGENLANAARLRDEAAIAQVAPQLSAMRQMFETEGRAKLEALAEDQRAEFMQRHYGGLKDMMDGLETQRMRDALSALSKIDPRAPYYTSGGPKRPRIIPGEDKKGAFYTIADEAGKENMKLYRAEADALKAAEDLQRARYEEQVKTLRGKKAAERTMEPVPRKYPNEAYPQPEGIGATLDANDPMGIQGAMRNIPEVTVRPEQPVRDPRFRPAADTREAFGMAGQPTPPRYSTPTPPAPPPVKGKAGKQAPKPAMKAAPEVPRAKEPTAAELADSTRAFAESFQRPDNYNLYDNEFGLDTPIKEERAQKAEESAPKPEPKSESVEVPRFEVGEEIGFRVRKESFDPVTKKKKGRKTEVKGRAKVKGYNPATRKYTVEQLLPNGKLETFELFPSREAKQMFKLNEMPAGDAATGRRGPDAANDKAAGGASTASGQKESTQSPPQKQYEARNLYSKPMDADHPVMQSLLRQLRNAGLDNVQLRIQRWIGGDSNVEGRFTAEQTKNGFVKTIEIAEGNLKPGMSMEEAARELGKVMNHEIVHALKQVGLLAENSRNWNTMVKYIRNKKVPGRDYTYLQQAEVKYSKEKPEVMIEEAMAAAYSDFANGDLAVSGEPRSIFGFVTKYFKKIADWLDPTSGGREFMTRLKKGEFADQVRKGDFDQKKSMGSASPDVTRFSRSAPDFVTMTEDTSVVEKTPRSEAEIRDSIGQRVKFSLNNADAVRRVQNLRHDAAQKMLAQFIQPFTKLFDYKHKLMGSAGEFPRMWSPVTGYGQMMDYKGRADEYAMTFVRKLSNRMIGLARFIDLIKENGGSVTEAFDSYMMNDAVIGKVQTELRARNMAMFTPALEKVSELKDTDRLLNRLADIGVNMAYMEKQAGRPSQSAVFDLYLAALHARERNAVMKVINPEGKPIYDADGVMLTEVNAKGETVPMIAPNDALSGMSNQEAQVVMKLVRESADFGKIDEAEKIVREIIRSTNDTRVEGELIPSKMDFRYMDSPMADAYRQAAFYDPELAYLAEEGYRYYVPLRGFADNLDNQDFSAATKARGLQFMPRQDYRALGRVSPASHILENLLLQNEESVIREKYAEVGRAFLRMIETNYENGDSKLQNTMYGMAEVVANVPLKPTLVEGSYQTVYNLDGNMEKVNVRGPYVAMLKDPKFRETLLDPDSPYYAVRRYRLDENGEVPRDANGRKIGEIEEVIIKIKNDHLRAAMKGVAGHGSETLRMIVDHMSKLTRFLANTVTSWNPEFLVANYQRDISEAIINSGQYEIEGLQATIAKHSLPAMRALWKMNPDARADFLLHGKLKDLDIGSLSDREKFYNKMANEFEIDGGSIEFLGMRDLASQIAHINNQFVKPDSMNTLQKSWEGVKRLGRFVESYNKAVENSTRLSVYISLREALEKKGLEPMAARRQAAYAAKNITANYNRGGEWKAGMNAFYMFYNASIQGTYGLLTAAKRSKKVRAAIGAIMVAGFLNDTTQGLISDTDESGTKVYDKIKDWQLETRMIFMDPFGISERGYIAIPMPYSYGAFWNFGRAISRYMRGGYDLGEVGGSAIGGILNALNPITGSHSFLNFMAPTLVDPIVDLSQNLNYQQRPIYKEASQFGVQAPNSQLYWNSTSQPAIAISDWVNQLTGGDAGVSGAVDMSPDVIDYTIGFLTGGAGKFIARVLSGGNDVLQGRLDDLETQDVPFVRQFVGSVGERDDVEQYMDARQRVLQPERAVRMALDSGDYQTAAKLRQRYSEELRLAATFKASDAARNRLTTRLREIRNNVNMTPEQKVVMEKTIKEAIARHETRALTVYNRSLE